MSAGDRPSRVRMKVATRGVMGVVCLDAMLFGLAGRIDWLAAWVVTLMFGGMFLFGGVWFLRHDPDLVQERMSTAPNVPRWDRLLMRVYSVLLLSLFVTAALDAGRFQWSHVPLAVQAASTAGILAAFAVILWCTAVNHFLSSLGSWLAVVPAVLIAVLFVIRTLLEDRLLTAALDGYRSYAERVPQRLVPGLW